MDPNGLGRWGAYNSDLAQSELQRRELEKQKKKAKGNIFGKILKTAGDVVSFIPGGQIPGALMSSGGTAINGGGIDDVIKSGLSAGFSGGLTDAATSTMANMPGIAGKVGGFMQGVPDQVSGALGGGGFGNAMGHVAQGYMMKPLTNSAMSGIAGMFSNPWMMSGREREEPRGYMGPNFYGMF
jgi:hypothetical protein